MYKFDAKPKRPVLPAGIRPELLLYVEDDDDNWDVAALRLSSAYEVIRARNDAEACDLIRKRRGEIDVILMDIELRGSQLNGAELTMLLRGNPLPPGVAIPSYAHNLPLVSKPVIFVTAHGARYTGVQLTLSGGDKVITKPVNFMQLKTALAELLMDRTSA